LKKIILFFLVVILELVAQESFYYKNNKKQILYPLHRDTRSVENIDYYQNERGQVLGVTDEIIVKTGDYETLKQNGEKYGFIIVKKLFTNLYLIRVSDRKETLQVANLLTMQKSVDFAHPNFIKKAIRR